MRLRETILFASLSAIAAGAYAEAISGTILIKKRLSKPNVTAAVSVYQRGTAVKLGEDAAQDPIAHEQSRVVIYLEGPALPAGEQIEQTSQKIEQVDRRFAPEMVVVPVGATVSFPNMDPIFHNIYSLSKTKSFDLGSYDRGETRRVKFPRPGIVEIYCHLHPNMQATVVVTPNRWYARPDRDGQYRIPDVPPGAYTVVAWHKTAGFFRKTIVVTAGGNATADFFIPLEADPQPGLKDGDAGHAGESQ
jgi:plastocyanin